MSGDLNDTICLPMKLDAFVFNGPVCSGGAEKDEARAKIAPITQPNYTMLRIYDALIQSDILPHVDIHNAYKNEYNSRLTDLDTGKPYLHRQGVYLHWMLPRVYRAGVAATGEGNIDHGGEGLPESEDSSAPQFRSIPSRWLVIRRLRESVPDYKTIDVDEYEAWVIESDKQRKLGDPTKPENLPSDIDLQVEVAPFISAPLKKGKDVSIDEQAEVFIGSKTPMSRWTEPGDVRSPVTVLNGGNMLFPDYQYHNANVLSVLDNFKYGSGDNIKYMESATADYYVIGWHASTDQDPFTITNGMSKRSHRLETFQMRFDEKSKDGASWSELSKSGQTVCHGAMYNVEWDKQKRPQNIPADKLCKDLQKLSPVSFGTTALDSLLAYVEAQQADETDQALKNVMTAIVNIQKYLLVDEDTVDGHDKAHDLLYNTNFDNLSGGTRYHIARATDPKIPTQKPDPQIIKDLSSLNQEQCRLDALDRLEERIRWDIFSVWWEYVSRGTKPTKSDQDHTREKLLAPLLRLKKDLEDKREESQEKKNEALRRLDSLIKDKVISLTARSNFHTQQDPTLIVGHIQSAWPCDWLDPLLVRVNTDITTWGSQGEPGVGGNIDLGKLPSGIQDTVSALIKEFIKLGKDNDGGDAIPPLYHDIEPGQSTRRDDWGHTQPFFPLFLEWEAEYAHVDYAQWSLDSRVFGGQASEKVSFGMTSQEPLYDKDEWNPDKTPKAEQNTRVLSGRVLILPQASFSLQAQIKQLIDQTPREELERALGKDIDPKTLLADLNKLKFLSSPLAGFHDNLSTVSQGTHIKPLVRYSGEKLQIIKHANDITAGFADEVVRYMGTETDLTPYATLVSLSTDPKDGPFKPATHGQFKITKLNIVDKFGQVIHALDPRWDAQPQNIRPCISEFLAPQSLPDNTPNIVEKPKPGEMGSHYVQMPPHINQWAKVNSAFMAMTKDGTKWVPQNEWDKPIWGWIVYNYLDKAVQFFLEDGTFYQEVRMGERAVQSKQWLPFKKTVEVEKKNNQLDRLIYHAVKDEGYLESMLLMIAGAMESAAVAPDAYGQFLNSIIGRPLALINMGWSLELGTPENTNHSTVNTNPPLRHLLRSSAGDKVADDKLYTFPLKMGDEHRAYDGLVGYFETYKNLQDQKPGDYLDLSKCYTYFGTENKVSGSELLVKIDKTKYPVLEPYYIDPIKTDAAEMENIRNEMLRKATYGAIVDPFRPVHGYTSILPIEPLKIPEWTWQEALAKMTAFFHFGPLNVTKDVPDFQRDFLLTEETDIKKDESTIPNGIRLPQMGTADWVWLQPYSLPPKENAPEKKEETGFMPLGIAGAETAAKLEEGPYTSVEGYLLLRQPIVRAE